MDNQKNPKHATGESAAALFTYENQIVKMKNTDPSGQVISSSDIESGSGAKRFEELQVISKPWTY
ncbi:MULTISPECIES: hypothetical protein [Bacillus cereus group]|uniref:hypothetical protein n=1 Tax=Bacillus cereus group TaxID=86661 RepID=UPI000CD8D5D9|nr:MULTISPECIES: hypothetical protein [Bacillus cereus group]MBG9832104.1 hypothetical protein [Bacillus wiedmannii]MED3080260.1 hypothetical protein [Bacillus wiedmannii]UOB98490.1 hypothetical protein BTI679_58890 [Bacillus wiedmannii]